MNETDKQSFAVLLATMGEIYKMVVKPQLIECYWQLLKPYPWQDIKQALHAHFVEPRQGCFFPKPADVIALIHRPIENHAEEAWAKVIRALQEVGAYHSVKFDDPIIHCVLNKLNGWVTLCRSDRYHLKEYGEYFKYTYQKFMMEKELPPFPPYFRGLLACSSQQSIVEPVLIDDQLPPSLTPKKIAMDHEE
jgi:hypothetical protein